MLQHIQPEVAMTAIDILLDRTRRHAVDFLNGLDHRPVQPTATLDELRRRLGAPLKDRGTDAAQVIDDLSTWDNNATLYLSGDADQRCGG
jgi:hypothetical protein